MAYTLKFVSGGGVATRGAITGGSGYTNASGLSTSATTGMGCTVNITTSGGAITGVTIASGGGGYLVGDSLTVIQGVNTTGSFIVATTNDNTYADTLNPDASSRYYSASILPNVTFDCSRVDIILRKLGAPTFSIYGKLFSSTGTHPNSKPNTLLGTSDAITHSSISTSLSYISFIFSTPVTLTNGTRYHFALYGNPVGSWDDNYIYIEGDSTTSETVNYADNTPTWSQLYTDDTYMMRFYETAGGEATIYPDMWHPKIEQPLLTKNEVIPY